MVIVRIIMILIICFIPSKIRCHTINSRLKNLDKFLIGDLPGAINLQESSKTWLRSLTKEDTSYNLLDRLAEKTALFSQI